MKTSSAFVSAVILGAIALGCSGSTGGGVFSFPASAAGPERDTSTPFRFVTPTGWTVTLTRAKLQVGPLYVNHALSISQSQSTFGYSGGRYIAQVQGQLVVDALEPEPKAFDVAGEAVAEIAQAGEVWLYPVAGDDASTILDVAGEAVRDSDTVPFAGTLTIDRTWLLPDSPGMPGASPLASLRQVPNIPVSFATSPGGRLVVRVNPAHWFDGVFDFAALRENGADAQGSFQLGTAGLASDAATVAIFRGIRAREGVYRFDWVTAR